MASSLAYACVIARVTKRDEGIDMKTRRSQKKYIRVRNPIKVIDKAIGEEDWFSAFTNSVTYFEYYGYWRLRWYCIKEKIDVKEKLKNLRVGSLALVLFLLKLIDRNTYSKMNKIIKERNKLIHPAIAGITYRDRKKKDRAIQLLEDAKFCITELKKGIGHE